MIDPNRRSGIELIHAAAEALKARREEVDRLNVFPVPDGDTGTNMSLTMDAVLADVDALPPGASLAEICRAVAHGSLMGARGNSGVILSQILRGLCDVLGATDRITADVVAAALERAVTVAFQAVRKPVEGTMLTVIRDAAHVARELAHRGTSLDALLDAVVQEAFESVKRGPDLLPVLKEHGVVDAGGFGLAILMEGFVAGLEGHEVRERRIQTTVADLTVEPVDDWDDAEYLYCTEFLLHDSGADRSSLESRIAEHGGSELVVGDAETYKIHVHTNDPGAVISWATSLGQVAEVHINNMRRQTQRRTEVIRSDAGPEDRKPVGFVAVAFGEGLAAILTSLGVDEIVSGGQTMNPSTAEILEAVKRVRADRVVILPNNRNIIMAAQQVASLEKRPVAVVPTTSVPEAFSALLAFDAHAPFEEAVEAMTEAASYVKTGEVTRAIKDAKAKAGHVKEGQFIGITNHEIEVVGDDLLSVSTDLVGRMVDEESATVTVLAGAELDDESLEELVRRIEEAYPDLEVEAHRGEQPLYPVIIGVE